MEKPVVKFVKVNPEAIIPSYAHPGDAGMDLCIIQDITIYERQTKLTKIGLRVKIPDGYEGQVRSRSGMALKGIVVANSPGTIDSGYTGELGIILRNNGEFCTLKKGTKVAQLVIAPVSTAEVEEVEDFEETERGDGGFGSTGERHG